VQADVGILCMHHCVEGAKVGPRDYTFRDAPDVIRRRDLPSGLDAVLSGHIHRYQVLRAPGGDREGPPPVFYSGSVERTAFAEAGEEKGFLLLTVECGGGQAPRVLHEFVPLPARPMVVRDLFPPAGSGPQWSGTDLMARIGAAVEEVPGDAVLRIRVGGRVPESLAPFFTDRRLRRLTPPSMNLEVSVLDAEWKPGPGRRRRRSEESPGQHVGRGPHADPNQLRLAF
jgi:DNA repair exonuclease SbcCD nuclease subunit